MRHQALAGLAVMFAAVAAWWWLTAIPPHGAEAQEGRSAGRPSPVEVVSPRRGTVFERVEAVGTTRARDKVDIVPLTSGRITEIAVGEGERVEAGDLLFQLEDDQERAGVLEAEAELENIRIQYERARQLIERKAVAAAQVDELRTEVDGARARLARAQAEFGDRQIKAPFAGVTGLHEVSVGAYVDEGDMLTTLDDLREIEIEFTVPERYFSKVMPGMKVEAESIAFAGTQYTGDVIDIGTRIDPQSRSFQVRALLPNDDGRLPDGLFMNVRLILERFDDRLLVPREAVIAEGSETFVFVVDDDRAVRTPVTVGRRLPDDAEIQAGLDDGDLVVVRGQQRLRDGSPVRIREPPAPVPPTS